VSHSVHTSHTLTLVICKETYRLLLLGFHIATIHAVTSRFLLKFITPMSYQGYVASGGRMIDEGGAAGGRRIGERD
jgi:hypothetical protein